MNLCCDECPACGDRLIHQRYRRSDESSSAFGQWIHDTFPNTFYHADVDSAIFKRATAILRVLEVKKHGQPLKPSQTAVLPILASGVAVHIAAGELDPVSGVFKVETDEPFDSGGRVAQVRPVLDRGERLSGPYVGPFSDLEGIEWVRFVTGEHTTARLF